jgi:hypothetical protein
MLLVKSCTPIGAHASCAIFKPYWENIIVIPTKAWKSTRKNSGADPKKTGAAAVCAISHRMGRTFLCMEIPLTRGNLGGKNPGAAPQKTGADKEKLHTKSKAHCTSASLSRGGCQMPGESEHCTPSW